MKCKNCVALELTDYECGVYECCIGVSEDDEVEYEDGESGCKLHWKTIKKIIKERERCFEISLADGQLMCNPEEYKKRLEKVNAKIYIEQAKHCIGLDYSNPYKRNGKLYYRPYRNYFNTIYDDEIWSDLRWLGYAECDCKCWEVEKSKTVFFHLNDDGRKWLADKLGIFKIWEER